MLSLLDFTRLFLVKMTNNSWNQKTANIPFNYRERIENILCANNNWKEEFSVLINIDKYFEDHFDWERRFASEILKVASELGKHIEFDIISEYRSITFSKKEINRILANYNHDTKSREKMRRLNE